MPEGAREFVGYGRNEPAVYWPNGARVAVSLVINFEEGAEQTPLYGDSQADTMRERFAVPAGERDLRTESFFEYGSRSGFWRLLDVLDKNRVKCTYFVSGMAVEQNPIAAKEITGAGHEPCGHGYRWGPQYTLTIDQERQHINKAVQAIEQATGERPRGWNSRGPSAHTRQLLVEEGGFLYDSESHAEDLPYFVDVSHRKWLTIPYSFETNDMKFFRAPGHAEPEDFLAQLTSAFDCLYEEGREHPRLLSVGLHQRYSGTPAGASAVDEFIQYCHRVPDIWFARRIDIARWWLENFNDLPAFAS